MADETEQERIDRYFRRGLTPRESAQKILLRLRLTEKIARRVLAGNWRKKNG